MPIKLVFFVQSIAEARLAARSLGGGVNTVSQEWQFEGSKICDGMIPKPTSFSLESLSANYALHRASAGGAPHCKNQKEYPSQYRTVKNSHRVTIFDDRMDNVYIHFGNSTRASRDTTPSRQIARVR
jgi:hypothetical protein